MRCKLNDKEFEYEPRRVMDVAALKRRMAQGALLYWTMVRPAHAVLFDPKTQTVAQLAAFRELWGLQRSKQIRHDHYDGIYQVFLPTEKLLAQEGVIQAAATQADTLFAQSSPIDSILFEPSI